MNTWKLVRWVARCPWEQDTFKEPEMIYDATQEGIVFVYSSLYDIAAYIAACDPQTVLGLLARVEELERWKAEQLQVESEWDAQAVGQALQLPPGTSIRKAIAPAIDALQQSNAQLRRQVDILAKYAAERDRMHIQQMAGLAELLRGNAQLQRQLEAMERLVRKLMRDTGAGSLSWSYWKDHNPQGEAESREEWLTRFNRDEAKHSAEFDAEIQSAIKAAKEQG